MTEFTQAEIVRWLSRVEGKLDDNLQDHEDRLRVIEQRPVVTTKQVYGASVLGCTALGVIIAALTFMLQVLTSSTG